MKNLEIKKDKKNTSQNQEIKNQYLEEQFIDERVAESYYLEDEAWQDVSVAKSYGPARGYRTCPRCSTWHTCNFPTTPCPKCGHQDCLSCQQAGCRTQVYRQGDYCSNHSSTCQKNYCSARTPNSVPYCSSHGKKCQSCNTIISSNETYCFSHLNTSFQQGYNNNIYCANPNGCNYVVNNRGEYCFQHVKSCDRSGCSNRTSSSQTYCSTNCEVNDLRQQQVSNNTSNQSTIQYLNQQNSNLSSQLTTVQNNYQVEQASRRTAEQERDSRPNVTINDYNNLRNDLNNWTNQFPGQNHQQVNNTVNNLQNQVNQLNNQINGLQGQLIQAQNTVNNAQINLGVNINNLPNIPAGQNLNTLIGTHNQVIGSGRTLAQLITDSNNLPTETTRVSNLQTQLDAIQQELEEIERNYAIVDESLIQEQNEHERTRNRLANLLNTTRTRLNTRRLNDLPQLPQNETVNSLLNRPTRQELQNANNAIGDLNRRIDGLTNERDSRPTQQQLDRQIRERDASRERRQREFNDRLESNNQVLRNYFDEGTVARVVQQQEVRWQRQGENN